MSAGRNLITLFFTVNTLLHFFFEPPSRCHAAKGDRRRARHPAASPHRRAHAIALKKNHFFSAVFFVHRQFEHPPQTPGTPRTPNASASSAACPPAENFFGNDCTSGVAPVEMRKLIARFDRHACVDARARQGERRDRLQRRSQPIRRSQCAHCILTNDSPGNRAAGADRERYRHAPQCMTPGTPLGVTPAAVQRCCADHRPILSLDALSGVHARQNPPPCRQKNGRSLSGHGVAVDQNRISGRRLQAARHSRPAPAGR